MADWLALLESLAPVAALRGSFVLYPIINAMHIMGISLLLGTIVVVDLRIIGLFQGKLWRQGLRELLPWSRVGFALAALTGLTLFSIRATEYIANPALQIKMGLLTLALLNVVLFHHLKPSEDVENPGTKLRLSAGVSLLLWISCVLAGRAVGFL